MDPRQAYQKILLAMNNLHDKKDKFLKRIHKKSKRYRYFRVPEYEPYLIKDLKICYWYARHVVHGRLPEGMHNFMLCQALSEPNNDYVKNYFKICKNDFDSLPCESENIGTIRANLYRY
jgi:hypothetical protein